MSQIVDCSEFCRLCLVKEQVNTPIFEEDGGYHQLSTKISTCLPVKVSREDSLPKRICDGCCYKVEQQYQFWNISLNAEKQFKQWLGISEDTETAKQNVNKIKKESTYDGPSASKRPKRNARRKAVQNIRQATAAQQSDSDSDIPLAARTVAPSIEVEPIAKDENDSDHHDFPEDNDSMDPPNFVNMNLEGEQDQAGPSGLQKAESTEPVEAAPATLNMEIEAGEGYAEPIAEQILPISISQISFDSSNEDNKVQKNYDNNSYTLCSQIESTNIVSKSKINRKNIKLDKVSLVCPHCQKVFQKKHNLETHLLAHTDDKPFPCDNCAKCFKSLSQLNKHKIIHSGIKPFVCVICSYAFCVKQALKMHMLKHSEEKKLVCHICGKRFKHISFLKGHLFKHKPERPSCEICGKSYSYENDFKRHVRTHDPDYVIKTNNYPCELCDKKFPRQSGLDFHVRVEHKGQLLVCDVCGKDFRTKDGLRHHIRSHTGEKPYKCALCEKCFITKNLLRVHSRTHTGERPYKCSECEKSFTQSSSLIVHKRGHTGERPYACHLCPKAFVSKSLLKAHFKSH